MALPTAILLSGIQPPQLHEIPRPPTELLQGLEELKKEKEISGGALLTNPYLKMVSSLDSGIGTDSDNSRTPSPNKNDQVTEFEYKSNAVDDEEKKPELETVPEENATDVEEDKVEAMAMDVVEPVCATENKVQPMVVTDNASEVSSEHAEEVATDSAEWLVAIGNSVDKLKYYMGVIDRLESKFTLFAQSNCPEGHIYSSLDPKIMHENRDILDLAENVRGNNWKFQPAATTLTRDNDYVLHQTKLPSMDPIKKCKVDDCNYNEPIYD